jgi:23S rRNA (adenine2503-C2)-methyltransferase
VVNVALQALSPEDLAERAGIDLTDARRIVSLVHRTGHLPERSPATIRRAALDAARAIGHVPAIERVERRASAVDPFVKYAFRLHDGAVVETVRIPLEKEGRFSVCVSRRWGARSHARSARPARWG